MKNKMASGISLALLGAIISFMPNFLMGHHCLQNLGTKCYFAAKTEFGIGILIILLAIFFIYFDSKEIKFGISFSLSLVGIFSALTPSLLIGFCSGSCSMQCTCNSATSLIMIILSILVTLISFVNCILLNRSRQ